MTFFIGNSPFVLRSPTLASNAIAIAVETVGVAAGHLHLMADVRAVEVPTVVVGIRPGAGTPNQRRRNDDDRGKARHVVTIRSRAAEPETSSVAMPALGGLL